MSNAFRCEFEFENELGCDRILCVAECDIEEAGLRARPRTSAGQVRQFVIAAEYLAESVMLCNDGPLLDEKEKVIPLVTNIARAIAGSDASNFATLERLAKNLAAIT